MVLPTEPTTSAAAQRAVAVKHAARRMGFTAVGITTAEALDVPRARLADWVSQGRHGQMTYLAQFAERHARFRASMPGLRSLIIVAASYFAEGVASDGRAGQGGHIARYAAGRDYHKVLRKRLKQLAAAVQTLTEAPVAVRWCVDTAPLHERSLAAAAGLGFIGKNTCLIVPRGGSWVVLGLLATDLELSPDAPITQTCGACTRCLDACPTGALTAPYEMDARRCIAYLTLEHRGPVPETLRPAMGSWLAGCDICQEVCPYNAKPAPAVWQELTPAAGAGDTLPLADLLACRDPQAFEAHFAGTALMRPKYQGLVRNAALAAGNSRATELRPLLEARTDDPDPVIRDTVGWAIAQLPQPQNP